MVNGSGAGRVLFAALVFALWFPLAAAAQWDRPTAPVALPPVSIAAPDDVYAITLDPAALGFLDAWGLAYVHADGRGTGAWRGRADAVYFGLPLFLGLSAGFSLESVRPLGGAPTHGVGSFALAFAPARLVSIGTAFRYFRSREAPIDGHTGVDLSLALRPSSHFAISLIGHDLNALFDLTAARMAIPGTFVLATAYRPTGDDTLTVEAAGAVDSDGRVGVRGMLEVGIPGFGRAHAVTEVADVADRRDLRILGGLVLDWGSLSAGGGVFASGFDETPGFYAHGRIGGRRRTRGLPLRASIADVEQRGSLGERGLLRLVERLDRARHDAGTAGVLLRLRGTGLNLAHAQEVRLAIDALEREGKRVVCHLDAATGGEYYACAAASRTLLDPAGGIRLTGPSVDVILLGGLLQNIGLRADFVRIGDYKSAPEQFTNTTSSAPAIEQRVAILDSVYARLTSDLERDLELSPGEGARVLDEGPYAAPEALAAKLVSAPGDENVLEGELPRVFGRRMPLSKEIAGAPARRWGVAPRIGVVVVDGTIVDGDNVDVPFVDIHLSGARTVIASIDRFARDPSIAAIVLRVDSPGGSALASDQIWRAVVRARRRKPVIASFGAVAASGGYYIGAAAEEIWADPSTITGSIGIYYGKVDVAPLAERVGVNIEHFGRGRHAGAESMFRPFTPEERAMLAKKIRIWYRLFLDRVAKGRRMGVAEVDRVARGRVYTGDQALELGLVDRLGGYASALARARELGGLDANAEVVVAPFRPEGLLDYVFGGGQARETFGPGRPMPSLTPALRETLRMAMTLGHVGAGIPLALLPGSITIE